MIKKIVILLTIIISFSIVKASKRDLPIEMVNSFMGNNDLNKYYNKYPTALVVNDIIYYSWNVLSGKYTYDPKRYQLFSCKDIISCSSIDIYNNLDQIKNKKFDFLNEFAKKYGEKGISVLKIILSYAEPDISNQFNEINSNLIIDPNLNYFISKFLLIIKNQKSSFFENLQFLLDEKFEKVEYSTYYDPLIYLHSFNNKQIFELFLIQKINNYSNNQKILSIKEKKELIYLLRISSIIINKKLLTLNNMSEFLAFANKNEMDHLIKGLLSMNLERIHDHGGLPENFLLIYLIKNYISEY